MERVVRAVSVAAFPTEMDDARFLVSAQWPSNAATPEEAAVEIAGRMAAGQLPQIQVVNFGDGFRWTYEIVEDEPPPTTERQLSASVERIATGRGLNYGQAPCS